jgi:hypothetical protein
MSWPGNVGEAGDVTNPHVALGQSVGAPVYGPVTHELTTVAPLPTRDGRN